MDLLNTTLFEINEAQKIGRNKMYMGIVIVCACMYLIGIFMEWSEGWGNALIWPFLSDRSLLIAWLSCLFYYFAGRYLGARLGVEILIKGKQYPWSSIKYFFIGWICFLLLIALLLFIRDYFTGFSLSFNYFVEHLQYVLGFFGVSFLPVLAIAMWVGVQVKNTKLPGN